MNNGMRIVIIEDDPVFRQLTEMALNLENFEVNVFENGELGVKYLEDNLPNIDLILLDLFMPVLDGMQVLNWLRIIKKSTVKVIVMTAMIDNTIEKNLFSAGADKVLKKPLDIKMMMQAINELIK